MVTDDDDSIASLWRDILGCIREADTDEYANGDLYDRVQRLISKDPTTGCRYQVEADGRVIEITYRERQVLHLICKDMSATEVAQIIGLSPRTVEYYTANLKAKFNVATKKHLIEVVLSNTLLEKLAKDSADS